MLNLLKYRLRPETPSKEFATRSGKPKILENGENYSKVKLVIHSIIEKVAQNSSGWHVELRELMEHQHAGQPRPGRFGPILQCMILVYYFSIETTFT